jgi:hypothetical protein
MGPMRWFQLIPFLVVLCFDFVTLDAPLFQPGPRAVEMDDEEECAPQRPVRLRRRPSTLTAALPAHRYVLIPRVRRPEHVARTARSSDRPPWVTPATQARSAPVSALASPEAH